MKKKNIIRADFFINPANYGYSPCDDVQAIWREIIKPGIIGKNAKIPNSYVREQVQYYRKSFNANLRDYLFP